MMSRVLPGVVALLLHGAAASFGQAPSPGWVPVRFIHSRPPTDSQAWNPDTIVFRNGQRLTPELWAVAYVGQLPRTAGPPYLVLAAMGCYDCDDMTSIYVTLPSKGRLQTDQKGYYYPGAIRPLQSDTVFFRSRLFLGRCLDRSTDALVWFQEEKDSVGRWHHEVYQVKVEKDTIQHGLLHGPLPQLPVTLARVRSGLCREIKGQNQVEY